jgi:hypothetical protein
LFSYLQHGKFGWSEWPNASEAEMLTRLWLLLFLLIAMGWIDIRKAFEVYRNDNDKAKLLGHSILIIFLGAMVFNGTYYIASTELDTLESQSYHAEKMLRAAAHKGRDFKSLSKRLIRKRKPTAVNEKNVD